MNSVIEVLLDIFRQPAVVVALIALVGALAQRKSFAEVVKGAMKTLIGFLVLIAGAGVVVDALRPFGDMFQQAFGVHGVVPNNEVIVGEIIAQYGTAAALIFFFGMIVNLILAATTRYKYIYLSGHVAFYIAAMIAVILLQLGFENWQAIVLGSVVQGLYTTLAPALVQPFMPAVTGNDEVALGHTADAGVALSGLVGRLVRGKNPRSTEDLNLPRSLAFLRDTTVTTAIAMAILYLVVALFAGPDYIQKELSSGQNYVLYAFLQAATFAAGVFVILAGVRVVLAEIVPAFKGISEKLVRGAKPALDVPIIFPFAPNAVFIGFIASFVGGILSMVAMVFMGGPIIIPGVVAHFFTGAAAGVIGNAAGGRRGAILGAFANGIIISFSMLLLLPVLGQVGLHNSTFADSDYGVIGLSLGWIGEGLGRMALVGVVAAGVIAVYAVSLITHMRYRNRSTAAASGSGDNSPD